MADLIRDDRAVNFGIPPLLYNLSNVDFNLTFSFTIQIFEQAFARFEFYTVTRWNGYRYACFGDSVPAVRFATIM